MRVCVRMMMNTACDLLLSSFMFVAATVRDLLPSDIRDSISWYNMKQYTPFKTVTSLKKNNNNNRGFNVYLHYFVASHSQPRQTVNVRPQNAVLPHFQCLSIPADRRRHEQTLNVSSLLITFKRAIISKCF